jgi:excisionase family DNA binding protein
MTTDEKRTTSLGQVARVLGISRDAAYRGAKAGQIPTIKVGRRLLVPLSWLTRVLGD